jgi:hypothetical protein
MLAETPCLAGELMGYSPAFKPALWGISQAGAEDKHGRKEEGIEERVEAQVSQDDARRIQDEPRVSGENEQGRGSGRQALRR